MRKKQFNRDDVYIRPAFHPSAQAQKLQAAPGQLSCTLGVWGGKVLGLRFNPLSLMWQEDSCWPELSKDNTQERDQIYILCPRTQLGEKQVFCTKNNITWGYMGSVGVFCPISQLFNTLK